MLWEDEKKPPMWRRFVTPGLVVVVVCFVVFVFTHYVIPSVKTNEKTLKDTRIAEAESIYEKVEVAYAGNVIHFTLREYRLPPLGSNAGQIEDPLWHALSDILKKDPTLEVIHAEKTVMPRSSNRGDVWSWDLTMIALTRKR